MERTHTIPESEVEIGRRLRRAREKLLVSQTAFALTAGIGRERLGSYEYGYVPLPWLVGDKICDEFDISARWLVEGKGPLEPYLRPIELDGIELPARTLFSEVYRRFFADYYSPTLTRDRAKSLLTSLRQGDEQARDFEPDLRRAMRRLEAIAATLPRAVQWEIHRELSRILGKMWLKSLDAEKKPD